MTDHQVIRAAFYDAQKLRPYAINDEVLKAITPPGGEWTAVAKDGAITRSVVWGRTEVAQVNPEGSIDDVTEGQIAMGLRATPVLDMALRTILRLAKDGADLTLIARIAETAVAVPPYRKESSTHEASAKGATANRAAADAFAANVLPIVRQIQASGATTLRAIAEALNARGIRTARGGQWHAATVGNCLARA